MWTSRGNCMELYVDEWKDFGTNRTVALQRARGKADCVWVIDADDMIRGDFRFPPDIWARILICSDTGRRRSRILAPRCLKIPGCVLHEFSLCTDNRPVVTTKIIIGGIYFVLCFF